MKTSTIIKIIGIVCIVFGSLGALSHILEILMGPFAMVAENEKTQLAPELVLWSERLAYIGIVVSVIYAIAGYLFLLKKTSSIKFMYAALVISILYHVIPLFFLGQYSSATVVNYEFNLDNLISPFVDVLLLAVVIWISKYYFRPVPENSNRKPLSYEQLRKISTIGIFCLLIPVSFHLFSIYCFSKGGTREEGHELFNSYLPGFLEGRYTITLLGLALCIVAIVLSSIAMQSLWKSWKVLNIMVLSFSILVLMLNLFQMM